LNTNGIYQYEEPVDIDIANDPFNGEHKYVYFNATPIYDVIDDEGDYWTPGSLEIRINDFDISTDDFTYSTTVGNNGRAYYDDDENTKEPFGGLTDEQMKKIKGYLDGMDLKDWGFFD
jgi:hypothetical protein